MYTYDLSVIGPLGRTWWTDRGLEPRYDCAGGRLHAYDVVVENGPALQEYPIAVMDQFSWSKLNIWFLQLQTEEILTLAELLDNFVEATNTEIGWVLVDGARQEVDYPTAGEI